MINWGDIVSDSRSGGTGIRGAVMTGRNRHVRIRDIGADLRGDDRGVWGVVGNCGAGVQSSEMNVGNIHVRACCKFGLGFGGWQLSGRSEGTYLKITANPVQV